MIVLDIFQTGVTSNDTDKVVSSTHTHTHTHTHTNTNTHTHTHTHTHIFIPFEDHEPTLWTCTHGHTKYNNNGYIVHGSTLYSLVINEVGCFGTSC